MIAKVPAIASMGNDEFTNLVNKIPPPVAGDSLQNFDNLMVKFQSPDVI